MDSSAVATKTDLLLVHHRDRPPQRDKDKDKAIKRKDEEDQEQKAAAMTELRISSAWPAVTQTSALIPGSTSRWSEESHISCRSRQTYDVDSGGISLTD